MTEEKTHTPLQRAPLDEVKASLLYLKSLGLQGVECTDEAAKLLGAMGRVAPAGGPGNRRGTQGRAGGRPQAQGSGQQGQARQNPSAVRPSVAKPVAEPSQASVGPAKEMGAVQPPNSVGMRRPAVEPVVETLESIRADLGECTRCGLFRGRNQIVFGAGSPDARLMFIGDVPLSEEDQEGIPFLGASGDLLNKMLQAMGLTRNDVYLSNILKCCPGDNQKKPDMSLCLSFLERQIAVVRPEVICTLGAVAAQTLLGITSGVGGIRGQFQHYKGIRLMPTFHPTFLLRHPEHKRQAWQDLQQVMAALGLESRR